MIHHPSGDVLLDLILDDLPPATVNNEHVADCEHCAEELDALRTLQASFEWAHAEPMPDAWMDAVLARIEEERNPLAAASLRELFAESLPTLGLASVTVLGCVTLFAPGGELGHPAGLLFYSVSAGALAAGWEAMQSLKDDELTSA
jgi:anti-sigma factor RsiW